MNWKKVPKQDTTKDWLYHFQNFSDIPNSYVYLYMDTDGTGPTAEARPTHKLIAHQVMRLPIDKGVTVYYAEENGGIFVFSKAQKVPFKNFDVPIFHDDVILSSPHKFTAPAGSMIVLQNMTQSSDGNDIYINIGGTDAGDGWFRLTPSATFWWTFAEEMPIVIRGTKGVETVSIFQQRSLSVTELSDETQKLLEDIINRIALIEEAMARKEELEEVRKRTYLGLWSPLDAVTSTSSNTLTTNPFISLLEKYRSEPFTIGSIIDVVTEFKLTYEVDSREFTETAYLQFRFKYTQNNTDEFILIDTGNRYLKEHLKSIKIDTNNTNDGIRFTYNFDTPVNTIICKTTIKSSLMAFGLSETQINPQTTTTYNFNLFNQGIIFTDDLFLLKMLKPYEVFQIPTYKISTHTVKTGADLVANNPIDNYNVFKIERGNFTIQYYEPFDKNTYPAYITVDTPQDFTFTSIIGFRLVPKDKLAPKSYILNIGAILDKAQEYQILNNKHHITSFIFKSNQLEYGYMDEYKKITTDALSKCDLEILYYNNKQTFEVI